MTQIRHLAKQGLRMRFQPPKTSLSFHYTKSGRNVSEQAGNLDGLHLARGLDTEGTGNFFETIFENFPDIIHSVDDTGQIVFTNRRACELLGYSKQELLSMSIFDIYPAEIALEVRKGFEELKREGYKDRIESQLQAKDGTVIDVEIRSFSVYDNAGKFVKTFSIIRDIRELNELKGQLVQQSKLSAIGELAAGIFHDIRNPLTVIMAFNGQSLPLAIERGDKEKLQSIQGKIAKASQRIHTLCDHLSKFTRAEVEAVQTISITDLMDDSLLMVTARLSQARAEVINTIPKNKYTIKGRPNQLEQVFINLLSNAADAVANRDQRQITLKSYEKDNHVVVEIKDTGPGIQPSDIGQIFDSFFTTKKKGQGTGLGLSISRGIMREHGGDLTVESTFGAGATFRVTLPVASN